MGDCRDGLLDDDDVVDADDLDDEAYLSYLDALAAAQAGCVAHVGLSYP